MTRHGVAATTALTHPCDPPPLCLVCIVKQAVGVSKHLGSELGRQVLHWQTIVCVGAEDLRRLVHERRMRHGGHLEATHMVIHCDCRSPNFLFDCRRLDGPGLRLELRLRIRTETGRSFFVLVDSDEGCVSVLAVNKDWEARVFALEGMVHETTGSGVRLVEVVGRGESRCQVGW